MKIHGKVRRISISRVRERNQKVLMMELFAAFKRDTACLRRRPTPEGERTLIFASVSTEAAQELANVVGQIISVWPDYFPAKI